VTDNTRLADIAAAWLQGLAARGVTAIVTNGRLRILPSSAYKTLTDDELITLRHHRAAIKAAINAGVSFDVVRAAPIVEKPTPVPESPCKWCNRAPCIGDQHPAFATLHALDPIQQQRRNTEASEDAIDQLMAHAQQWPTARMRAKAEARQPAPTDEQQRQAALRSTLGWDAGTIKV
jgi:hypothetical protein